MKKPSVRMILPAVLSGVLMSIPWLVPHMGFVALFAFVPLLWLDCIASEAGVKRFWIWHYSVFVLWNALTTFWVCNATVGGGIFAVLANALQMSLIFGIFRLSKKKFTGTLPYIFLAALWIAWERFYFDAEISWPWLVLGNAFARSTRCIQWYEYTGSLGGSLWIWASNLAIFGLLKSLHDGSWSRWNVKGRAVALGSTFVLLVAPFVLSYTIYNNYEEVSEGTMDVLVGQPNLDPYHKFEAMTQEQQTDLYLGLMDEALSSRQGNEPLLLLAPETFTSRVICGDYESGSTWNAFLSFLGRHPGTGILFGASTYEFVPSRTAPSYTARRYSNGIWYETHNSAISLDASGDTEIYHKSRLVVGTELMPYPAVLSKLDDLLGGVMGRCVGQDEISLLHFNGVPIGCAVCYESIYGEFCTGYVKKGARAMTVITNDAWWGDTPGYRQHLSYSCLRAIELRRDIARCANTGISAFIDQRGDIVSESSWWEQATLPGELNLSDDQTFFVRYGDIVGRACTLLSVLLLLLLLVRSIISRK